MAIISIKNVLIFLVWVLSKYFKRLPSFLENEWDEIYKTTEIDGKLMEFIKFGEIFHNFESKSVYLKKLFRDLSGLPWLIT
jgi:hypothetical protein